jgi:S-adenosylmethionine decarboxylase
MVGKFRKNGNPTLLSVRFRVIILVALDPASTFACHNVPMKTATPPLPPSMASRGSSNLVPSDFEFVGRHLMASYVDCDPDALRDLEGLEDAMRQAVLASGATLLTSARHVFPPDGMTIVMLLSESHASIHTYPEHNSCFVDLFTCGLDCRAEDFDAVLRAYLRPAESNATTWIRHSGIQQDRFRSRRDRSPA